MTCVIPCTTPGMLPMSKMNPDRMNAGRNVAMIATWPATNWFFVTVEISSPIPSAASRNSEDAANNKTSDPRNGTPNNHTPIATDNAMPPVPEHEIGQQLADQHLAHRHRRHHQRLHRAALPFARHHQRRQQRADQCHDDRDQARHEKVAAAQLAVEPDALLDLQRRAQTSRRARAPAVPAIVCQTPCT